MKVLPIQSMISSKGRLGAFGSPSFLLLAACLFFAAIPTVRVYAYISYCDVLFVLAAASGICERILHRELAASAVVTRVLSAYVLATALLTVCLFVNALVDDRSVGQASVWIKSARGYGLTRNASLLFGGEAPQLGVFLVFMFNAVMMPVLMLFVRINSAVQFKWLIAMWTAGVLYNCAFTVAYCNGWITGHYDLSWMQLRRAKGLTAQANILAIYAMLAMPGLLLLFESRPNWWKRVLAVIGMVLVWKTINYTGSRSCLVGAMLIVPLFLIARETTVHGQIKMMATVSGLGALVLGLQASLVALLQPSSHSALTRLTVGSRSSDTIRDLINTTAWSQAWDSPFFGVGYQMLRVAHNIYLQMFHAAGLVGLVGYLIVLAVPLMLLRGAVQRGSNASVSAAILAGLGAVLIISWVKSNPSEFSVALIFSLAVYWGLAIRQQSTVGFSPLRRLE